MNHRAANQSGYILMLTLLMLTASITVVTYIFHRGSAYIPLMQVMINRKKATLFAESGIAIGMSIVGKQPPQVPAEQPQEQQPAQPPTGISPVAEARHLLENVLPQLNQLQSFSIDQELLGSDGTLAIVLSCENGKIDVNEIYDFKKKQFRGTGQTTGDWSIFLQELFKTIESTLSGSGLFDALQRYLAERGHPVNDVTELLAIKEFEIFKNNIFYGPVLPTFAEQPRRSGEPQANIYLTDIFTVTSGKATIEPWLLSHSLRILLGLPLTISGSTKEQRSTVATVLKSFKKTANWTQDWGTTLGVLYGKELNSLPKDIESFLSRTFEPTRFSVLSYGTVGNITQRLLAHLERIKNTRDGKPYYEVRVLRTYWL